MAKIRIVLNEQAGYFIGNDNIHPIIKASPYICAALQLSPNMKKITLPDKCIGIFFSIFIFIDASKDADYIEQKQVLYLNIEQSFLKLFRSFYNR